MLPKKAAVKSKSNSADKRPKVQVKQSNSHRIKSETPRPHAGILWSDVKTGFKHFKIKRWNSIGSWVGRSLHCCLLVYKRSLEALQFENYVFESKLNKLQAHSSLLFPH